MGKALRANRATKIKLIFLQQSAKVLTLLGRERRVYFCYSMSLIKRYSSEGWTSLRGSTEFILALYIPLFLFYDILLSAISSLLLTQNLLLSLGFEPRVGSMPSAIEAVAQTAHHQFQVQTLVSHLSSIGMLLKNDFLPSRIADKLDDVDRDLDFFPLKMLNDDELDDDADECLKY